MSECCHDALGCRPEELCRALAIHTRKITDSCRDKDCIEDLRVYLTRESQSILDAAGGAKVRAAELIHTTIDVTPVAFHPNHYAIDLTFFYKVLADAAVSPCRPAAICGLALFSKRAVLCGENTGAHIFRSDAAGGTAGSLPTAVVEAIATNSRCEKVADICENGKRTPVFRRENNPENGLIFPAQIVPTVGRACRPCHTGGKLFLFYLDRLQKSWVFSVFGTAIWTLTAAGSDPGRALFRAGKPYLSGFFDFMRTGVK